MKPLTVETLKTLVFATSMHLNRGKQHDTTIWNEEYKLLISSTAERPRWAIVAKTLSSSITPHVANLLNYKDYAGELERFVAAYNEALGKCEGNAP